MKTHLRFLPNFLTLLRLLLCPVFALVLSDWSTPSQRTGSLSLALGIYGVVCLSDWLDGRIARWVGSTSKFGGMLDVLADLLFIVTASVVFNLSSLLPWWFTGVVITKFAEFVITSRLLRANHGYQGNPFLFDAAGRVAACLFYTLPGVLLSEEALALPHYLSWSVIFTTSALSLISSFARIQRCYRVVGNNRSANSLSAS